MANYENTPITEVKRLAKQGDNDALFEMVWRIEAMPYGGNDPVARCAWQDYWFEKAADAGNVTSKGRFARNLYIMYPFDVENHKKAKKYFEELVRDFDSGKLKEDEKIDGITSKLWLGLMLCQGLGIPRDIDKGLKLLKEADSLTDGFNKFGYLQLNKLAETFGQGAAQASGEPSVDDLRKAIAYQGKAVNRFKQDRDDPNNRGILELANQYLNNLKQRKNTKESQKDDMSVFGVSGSTGSGVSRGFIEWQEGARKVSPPAQQRLESDKAAIARLAQHLAREGW